MVEKLEIPGKDDSATVAVPAVTETAAMTDARRDELAAKLVDRFSLYSGAAGLIPLPLVDVAAIGGVQLHMLRRLSEIYGVPFAENLGKSLIASFAGSAVPATTAASAASIIKGLPGVGTGAGMLTMSAGAAGATYVIGKFFIQHFASGGTLLDFDVSRYGGPLKNHAGKLKGHTDRLKRYAEAGSEKLKSGTERLRSRFSSAQPTAGPDAAAAPASPAASASEP